jgi:hypothetical protein
VQLCRYSIQLSLFNCKETGARGNSVYTLNFTNEFSRCYFLVQVNEN